MAHDIKALAFDVGGTVFDWQTPIRAEIDARAGRLGIAVDSKAFAFDWRTRMFGILAEVRGGDLPWMNVDAIHRRALAAMKDDYPDLAFSDSDLDRLNRVWHRLTAWPDFPDALARLRERYTVIVLTVLSWSIAVDCSRASGIAWDGVLSCEFLGHYKPEPEVYWAAGRLLGLEPAAVMMVASHGADLRAAKDAGLATAYVAPKLKEPDFPGFTEASPDEFDIVATDFTELADKLC